MDIIKDRMATDPRIVILTGDFGCRVLDEIRGHYPDRVYNCGPAEQGMLSMASGMALAGKMVIAYTIAPFAIYRALEQLRLDIGHHKANVKIVTVGRDREYKDAGITHWVEDYYDVYDMLMHHVPNIAIGYPDTPDEIVLATREMLDTPGPYIMMLSRFLSSGQ